MDFEDDFSLPAAWYQGSRIREEKFTPPKKRPFTGHSIEDLPDNTKRKASKANPLPRQQSKTTWTSDLEMFVVECLIDGMSYREISSIVGLSVGAIKTRTYNTGLLELANEIKRERSE